MANPIESVRPTLENLRARLIAQGDTAPPPETDATQTDPEPQRAQPEGVLPEVEKLTENAVHGVEGAVSSVVSTIEHGVQEGVQSVGKLLGGLLGKRE